jgi:peptidoglycan lytic transglycosylase F
MRRRLLKLRRSTRRLIASSALFLIIVLLSQSRESTQLETILARGSIKFITRPGPITYYEDAKGQNGFEYLLARDFADFLGVTLDITSTNSLSQLFNMLGGPNGDFAGATLTITPERQKKYRFSQPYSEVVQVVLYRRGNRRPGSVDDLLEKRLAVVKDSSHEERLKELQQDNPDLSWNSIEGIEMIELMEMVNEGEVDYAIVDSTTYNAHQTIYPRAVTAFEISEPQHLAWAFPKRGDQSLLNAANLFLKDAHSTGRIKELDSKFFSNIENFSIAGSQLFRARMKTRLPAFKPLFQKAAKDRGMDWHLLAAIAYQESHWNPTAVSPTGVKGMMMLTRQAASEVGVNDRFNAAQSIHGGAQYFLYTKARIPKDIVDPDRTWLALAAYNVGLGHLEDARVLTERAGKDPHLWRHVREHLPLLQKKKYYLKARYGYARGQEPVTFVKNVRKYMRMLQWNTIEENRRTDREERQIQPDTPEWHPESFKTL